MTGLRRYHVKENTSNCLATQEKPIRIGVSKNNKKGEKTPNKNQNRKTPAKMDVRDGNWTFQ